MSQITHSFLVVYKKIANMQENTTTIRGVTTNDGKQVDIPSNILKYWSFFSPTSLNNFNKEIYSHIDFSSSEVESWLLLATVVVNNADLDKLAREKKQFKMIKWSIVGKISQFFLPTEDNNWIEYITIDNSDIQAYQQQGEWIRTHQKDRYYYVCKDWYEDQPKLVHNNFNLALDPVYDFKQQYRRHRNVTSFYYFDDITQEDRQQAMQITDLSILTGIVHSAFLKYLDDIDNEIYNTYITSLELPPELIDWKSIILLKYPRVLMDSYFRSTFTRCETIEKIKKLVKRKNIKFLDQVYSESKITSLPTFTMVVELLHNNKLSYSIDNIVNNKTYLSTQYDKLFTAMTSIVTNGDKKKVEKKFRNCGLLPLIYKKEKKRSRYLEFSYHCGDASHCHVSFYYISSIVTFMTVYVLYCGHMSRSIILDNGVTDIPIIEDVVKFGNKVIGSEKMIALANVCLEMNKVYPDERLVAFAEGIC